VAACAPPEEGKTRFTGLGPEPTGAEHGDYSQLWDTDQYDAVEAIVDERRKNGKAEYLVQWRGFDDSYNEWLNADKFSAGSTSLIKGWRERNKRSEEVKEMKEHKQASKAADRPVQIKPVNRTHFTPGSTAVAVLGVASYRVL
jgi:hypothetical protein